MPSKLSSIQIDKLSEYFIDLAKVWFASGVVGFFISDSAGKLPLENLLSGAGASFTFLIIGMLLLKTSKQT